MQQPARDDGFAFEADLGLEAGHGRRRILHAGRRATGQVLTSALLERAHAAPRASRCTPHTPGPHAAGHQTAVSAASRAGTQTFTRQRTSCSPPAATPRSVGAHDQCRREPRRRPQPGLPGRRQPGRPGVRPVPPDRPEPARPPGLSAERGSARRGRAPARPALATRCSTRSCRATSSPALCTATARTHGPVFLSLAHLDPRARP